MFSIANKTKTCLIWLIISLKFISKAKISKNLEKKAKSKILQGIIFKIYDSYLVQYSGVHSFHL